MFLSILILFSLLLLYYLCKINGKTSHKYKLPKGPQTVPILGNVLQVLVKPHLKFSEWAYKYGPIYTVNILGRPALVVNDVKTMKSVFAGMESTGKFNLAFLEFLSAGNHGVVCAEGKVWQELRLFTMKALRDCGMSRSSVIEPIIWQSCNELLDWFEQESKNSGVVFPFREKFIDCSSNIVWNIVSRSGEARDKSGIGKLVVKLIDSLQTTTNSGLLFLPWLKYVAPKWSGYTSLVNVALEIQAKIEKKFEDRRQYRKNTMIEPEDRNLLDAYLEHWENCTDVNSSFYGEVGWKHCFYSLVQLLSAGGDTTGTSLNWLVNYLVAYPDVQQKLYDEVKTVFGNKRPVLADRKRLPYLDAVIYETLRMSSLLPFGLIHRLIDSVKLDDYYLPEDMLLISNMYHVHNDKNVWGDPENFRPERFLELESIQKENVVAFQPGKRVCPGEGLAKDLIFLVTAALVQKFKFLPNTGKAPRDYVQPDFGYMLHPKQIGVKMVARY